MSAPADALAAAVARIARFMAGFSLEATRPSAADIAALAALPRATRIYLSAVPGRPADEVLSAAVRLRAAGFESVRVRTYDLGWVCTARLT